MNKSSSKRGKNYRILSLFLCFTMVFLSIPPLHGTVIKAEEKSSDEVFISAEYEVARDEFEKHFLLSDGSFMAVSYAEAVHYRSENGWVEADNRLSYDEKTSRISNQNTDFGVSFAPMPNPETHLVSLRKNGCDLSWTLSVSDGTDSFLPSSEYAPKYEEKGDDKDFSGRNVNNADAFDPEKAVGYIEYQKLFEEFPEISADYTVKQNRVEEDIYIHSPTTAKSFSMILNSINMIGIVNEDRSVSITDPEGETFFRIGIPYLADAKDETLYDIAVEVRNTDEQIIITYTPDSEWLTDESRAYPILLDPSITTKEYSSNIVDTYVVEGDNSSNFSSSKNMYFGIRSNKINRSYIKVNTFPNIDASMPVLSASLRIFFVSGTTTGQQTAVYKASAAWNPTTITYGNQPSILSSNLLSSVSFQTDYLTFDLSSDILSLYDEYSSGSNYGYVIKYYTENKNNPDYNKICSSETTAPQKMPYVTVNYGYSLPSSLSSGSVYAFQNLGSSSFMSVHNGSNADNVNVYQKSGSVENLSAAQKFKLEYVSSTGGYYLRAMCSSNGSNRVLDVVKTGGYVQNGCNVQIYSPNDDLAQHWFIIGIDQSSFRIVPRTDMNLALTSYPSYSNGTSSGTSSTSPGNIFVSTYSGSSLYQKWIIYDENGTPMSGLPGAITSGTW